MDALERLERRATTVNTDREFERIKLRLKRLTMKFSEFEDAMFQIQVFIKNIEAKEPRRSK